MLHLGLIPDFQFSGDPAVNPRLNPHVRFPPGMDQSTIQPVGSYVTSGDPSLAGAGVYGIFDSWPWRNRKVIALSVVGVLALGIAGVALKILK